MPTFLSRVMRILLSCLVACSLSQGVRAADSYWDVMSDTWVATDALGRKLPGYAECGPPRKGKTVGIFYFIWQGQHGVGGPYDISKILAENPTDPKWGPVSAFHHWGEAELGYYLADDEYVIRKNARMLAGAGVDFLTIDVTNGITYNSVYMKICEVYVRLRKEGLRTPQICFIANSGSAAVVNKLYDEFYSKNLYPELWFRWGGKPLVMAPPDGVRPEVQAFFTFRQSWAWAQSPWFADGWHKWCWLDNYPQTPGWDVKDVPEQISVTVAQHPTSNIGRSFHDGKQPDPADFKTAEGLCFAEQWKRALEVDPALVFITGWNEWVAQRFLSEGNGEEMCGRKLPKGETFFVDAYNQEYTRDIEPMKGGHTDSYYYQMIGNIRRYRGVRAPQPASAPKKITIDGKFDEWSAVSPEFRDYIGDTEHRNSKGWGDAGTYVNTTGRNDFVRTKVARDSKNVYFYAETKAPITSCKDKNWMLLFIDSDRNSSTGWNGYDYLVNSVVDARTTTVRKNLGGWKWSSGVKARYSVVGNKMEMAVPLAALGLAGKRPIAFDFHWADNIQAPNDIIEFAVSGDSAPDRRFNYRYTTAVK